LDHPPKKNPMDISFDPLPSTVKRMTARTFLRMGILLEVNRQFLHPLGFALATVPAKDGDGDELVIIDGREDRAGIAFTGDVLAHPELVERARLFIRFKNARHRARIETRGFIAQPIPAGMYCQFCGCNELDACMDDGVPCHWIETPTTGNLGSCSTCVNGPTVIQP
jgi:hypothetical protein